MQQPPRKEQAMIGHRIGGSPVVFDETDIRAMITSLAVCQSTLLDKADRYRGSASERVYISEAGDVGRALNKLMDASVVAEIPDGEADSPRDLIVAVADLISHWNADLEVPDHVQERVKRVMNRYQVGGEQ